MKIGVGVRFHQKLWYAKSSYEKKNKNKCELYKAAKFWIFLPFDFGFSQMSWEQQMVKMHFMFC